MFEFARRLAASNMPAPWARSSSGLTVDCETAWLGKTVNLTCGDAEVRVICIRLGLIVCQHFPDDLLLHHHIHLLFGKTKISILSFLDLAGVIVQGICSYPH